MKAAGYRLAVPLVAVTAFAALFLVAAGISDIGALQAKQSDGDTSNLYEDALARYNSGDIAGAIIQLKNLLQINPSNLPARILIGRAHLKRGDAESAEKELRRAQVEGGDEELLIVPLANATYLMERYDEVLEKFPTKGRSLDVKAGLLAVHGQAYLAKFKLEKAEDAFNEAAKLRPDKVLPIIGLARVYLARSQLHEARKLAKDAVAMAPDNFFAWMVNGRIARRFGDPKSALESFERVIELQPEYVPARIAHAMVLIDLRRPSELTADLEVIRKNEPNSPYGAYIEALLKASQKDEVGYEGSLQKADILLRGIDQKELFRDPSMLLLAGIVNFALKNYNDAYNFMREHIQRDRFHSGSRTVFARLLMRQGKNLDALGHLQVAAKLAPTNPEIQRLLGVVYMRNGRAQEASAAFKKAIEIDPENTSLQTTLALSQLRSGKRDDAVAGLTEIINRDETAVKPGIMLALIMIRGQEFDGALDITRRMIQRDPDNPVLYNLLGTALWAKGETETARESLLRAVTLYPNYLEAHRNLARLDLKSGNVNAAKARLESMIDMPGAGAKPLIELAEIASERGRFREGISLLTKAKEIDSSDLSIQLKIIDLLSRDGQGDAALRDARKLRDRLPDQAKVMEKLGQVELSFGKPEDAAVAFRRLANLIPETPNQLLGVARYQLRAQDLDGAHKTLKQALVADDGHLESLAEIINLEARLGRFEDALFRSVQVINRYPKRSLGHRLRGDVFVRMKRFRDAALAYQSAIERQPSGPLYVRQYLARRNAGVETPDLGPMETWIKDNPKDHATRIALASAYLHAKNSAAAQTLFEALNKDLPNNPLVLNNLAGLYLDADDERALKFAEAAYRLAPRQPQTLDTLGWTHVRQGRPERGLELLRDAFSRSSRDPVIRYHLAVALSQLGQTEEAKSHLQDVLKSKNVGDVATDAQRLLDKLGGG